VHAIFNLMQPERSGPTLGYDAMRSENEEIEVSALSFV
jgi:hypothetical protein